MRVIEGVSGQKEGHKTGGNKHGLKRIEGVTGKLEEVKEKVRGIG